MAGSFGRFDGEMSVFGGAAGPATSSSSCWRSFHIAMPRGSPMRPSLAMSSCSGSLPNAAAATPPRGDCAATRGTTACCSGSSACEKRRLSSCGRTVGDADGSLSSWEEASVSRCSSSWMSSGVAPEEDEARRSASPAMPTWLSVALRCRS